MRGWAASKSTAGSHLDTWDLMAGGMILEEELSISYGKEADHWLHQNIGHHVVNISEFTE